MKTYPGKTYLYTLIKDLEKETTKISKQALDELDREFIISLIIDDDVFWFEYPLPLSPSNKVHDYLVKFIKRKYDLDYLHEIIN